MTKHDICKCFKKIYERFEIFIVFIHAQLVECDNNIQLENVFAINDFSQKNFNQRY